MFIRPLPPSLAPTPRSFARPKPNINTPVVGQFIYVMSLKFEWKDFLKMMRIRSIKTSYISGEGGWGHPQLFLGMRKGHNFNLQGGERLTSNCKGERLTSNCKGERNTSTCKGERLTSNCKGGRLISNCKGERLTSNCKGERLTSNCKGPETYLKLQGG